MAHGHVPTSFTQVAHQFYKYIRYKYILFMEKCILEHFIYKMNGAGSCKGHTQKKEFTWNKDYLGSR